MRRQEPRGEQAGELQHSLGCVAVSIQGRESQPLPTGAGIPLCGYSIPEKVYFSKLTHKDYEMFEGLHSLTCCKSPKGVNGTG